MGDTGGTRSETAGSACIPPHVSITKGGNKEPVKSTTKPLSPLDGDIVAYLSRVATTASEEEVHRQVHRGQQGRTLALVRAALAKLVQAGLVDKVNSQYRLVAGGGAA